MFTKGKRKILGFDWLYTVQFWENSQMFDLHHPNSSILLMDPDKQLASKHEAFDGDTKDQTVGD